MKKIADVAWKKMESKDLGIALSRFTDGHERTKLEDRIIDYMIGLESLYLRGDGSGEFQYKMAHRASVLLSKDKEQRKQLFEDMKECYSLRSKIVYGMKYDLTINDVRSIEDVLRNSIKKFLINPRPDWSDLIF